MCRFYRQVERSCLVKEATASCAMDQFGDHHSDGSMSLYAYRPSGLLLVVGSSPVACSKSTKTIANQHSKVPMLTVMWHGLAYKATKSFKADTGWRMAD